jgi:hypothetical protein
MCCISVTVGKLRRKMQIAPARAREVVRQPRGASSPAAAVAGQYENVTQNLPADNFHPTRKLANPKNALLFLCLIATPIISVSSS